MFRFHKYVYFFLFEHCVFCSAIVFGTAFHFFWYFGFLFLKDGKDEQKLRNLPDLSEEEKQQIITSPEFQTFFDRSTRIVERALTEEVSDRNMYSQMSTSLVFLAITLAAF